MDDEYSGKWEFFNKSGKTELTGNYENGFRTGVWNYILQDTSYNLEWIVYDKKPIKMNLPAEWKLMMDNTINLPLLLKAYSDYGYKEIELLITTFPVEESLQMLI
jgi:hypothetical protein